MPDVTVPPLIPASTEGSIADYPFQWALREASRVMVSVRRDSGWEDVTATEFSETLSAIAKGFVAAGIEVGDRVGIMSHTRYEWTLVDFALWTVGAVPVPVYETSSSDQVEWILSDSGAVALVVEDQRLMALVSSVRERLPALNDLWQIDAGALEELVEAGSDVPEKALTERRSGLDRDDLATIIYTSGTTGRPKGCELTHDNFMALAENAAERLAIIMRAPQASTLIFLPLAHVFARFVQVVAVQSGVRIGHTIDAKEVFDDLAGFQPTFLLAVPWLFEKIYNSAAHQAEAAGRGKIFTWATRVAADYSRSLDVGRVGMVLKAQHAVADKLVYGKIRDALGGKVQFTISGGAALGDRLGHFFRGVGLVVLEGYDLTETTAPATVNTPDMIRVGTMGRPLPGVSVKVEEDGEILLRGINLFRGYHDHPEATVAAMAHGWFRTGDLGELDRDGFLRITGRKKELLLTAGGKTVSPGPLEDQLRAHPLISQSMVVGEGRPFVGALVTLDAEMLPLWAASRGLGDLSLQDAATDEAVLAEVQAAVDDANTAVSRAESIRAFRILATDFTIDNGLLTPSMKLKRRHVATELEEEIDAVYGGHPRSSSPRQTRRSPRHARTPPRAGAPGQPGRRR